MIIRCLANDERNAGFSAIVSERALINLDEILVSFAQVGTRPQWNACTSRCSPAVPGVATTPYTSFVGATLKLAGNGSALNEASKYSAILSALLEETNRPHIAATVPVGAASPS